MKMRKTTKWGALPKAVRKEILLIIIITAVFTAALLIMEYLPDDGDDTVTRNPYGGGKKTEQYELTIEGEAGKKPFEIEVEERKYTDEETKKMLGDVSGILDRIILGENKSFDRIETDLNLVTSLDEYPVSIRWEMDSYDAMDIEGHIKEENLPEEGMMTELRGVISYEQEMNVYMRNVMVYPRTRKGPEKLMYEIAAKVRDLEETSRQKAAFSLPAEVNGKKLQWGRPSRHRWYYVPALGVALGFFIIYRDREKARRAEAKRRAEMLRDYPGMISKFTMLLDAGSTLKGAWEKIVKNYDEQKEKTGTRVLYEEMTATLREIQGGVPETEAYERFGRRCREPALLKFGAMLSQNLKKGSRGLSRLLRMEAIQSFENRKSAAKRMGEEAGTKLLMPMLGMFAVVLVMVLIPAFMGMGF